MSGNNDNSQRAKHAKRIAKDCYGRAREMLGKGWSHVSVDIQRALVMEKVLANLLNQDESIDAHSALELTKMVAREADLLVWPGEH